MECNAQIVETICMTIIGLAVIIVPFYTITKL